MTATVISLSLARRRQGRTRPTPLEIRRLLFRTPAPTAPLDFLLATDHLTATEMVAWWRFRFSLWINGPVPNDIAALARAARVTPRRWAKLEPRFAQLFERTHAGAWTDRDLIAARDLIVGNVNCLMVSE